jgi:hypothetical protein
VPLSSRSPFGEGELEFVAVAMDAVDAVDAAEGPDAAVGNFQVDPPQQPPQLRKISTIPVTRYRYRGNKIPNPWVLRTTPTA